MKHFNQNLLNKTKDSYYFFHVVVVSAKQCQYGYLPNYFNIHYISIVFWAASHKAIEFKCKIKFIILYLFYLILIYPMIFEICTFVQVHVQLVFSPSGRPKRTEITKILVVLVHFVFVRCKFTKTKHLAKFNSNISRNGTFWLSKT